MEKEFVPYELAVKLKALGFDEHCFGYYLTKDLPYVKRGLKFGSEKYIGKHNSYDDFIVSTPTFSQCFRWFREMHELFGEPIMIIPEEGDLDGCITYIASVSNIMDYKKCPKIINKYFPTQEKAELACLEKLIEIVEQQKK